MKKQSFLHNGKRWLCLAIAAVMLLGMLPMYAFATGETYYVAGDVGLCGGESSWMLANENAKMTENPDGTYSKVFSNVAPGTYEFKVNDGTWDNSWGNGIGSPDGNYVLTVTETCDVTITFDPVAQKVTAETSSGAPAEPQILEITVHVQNTQNWEPFHLHSWGTQEGDTPWPGTALVENPSNPGWYDQTLHITEGGEAGVIPNGSNGVSGPQTQDIMLSEAGHYWITIGADSLATVLTYAPDSWSGEEAQVYPVTLFAQKPERWGSLYAHIWGSLTDNTSWPGVEMTANAANSGWYQLGTSFAKGSELGLVLNSNGTDQTSDIKITAPGTYWLTINDGDEGNKSVNLSQEKPGGWLDVAAPIPEATLYIRNTLGWDPISLYMWNTRTACPDWPGFTLTPNVTNSGWYEITVQLQDGATPGFVVSNGGNGSQTVDITDITEGGTYWLVIADETTDDGKYKYVKSSNPPEGWQEAKRFYVPGSFTGWDPAANEMTYDPALGLYTFTFPNVIPGKYEYKIAVNGTWDLAYGAGGNSEGGSANYSVDVKTEGPLTVYYSDVTHLSVTSANYVFEDITLSGTGIPEGTKLSDSGLTGIYSATVTLPAGTYSDVVMTRAQARTVYAFSAFTLEAETAVTFYLDPVTGIYYHNAGGAVEKTDEIYYHSQKPEYKAPYGALATGEQVTFTIQTGDNIRTSSLAIVGGETLAMSKVDGENAFSITTSFDAIGEYGYYFVLSDGGSVVVYGDDDKYYGEGIVTTLESVLPFGLVVYQDDFQTPDWMKNAVIYQIFPDRFFDGDPSNNQAQTWARGAVSYEFITDWYTLPENPEMLGKDGYLNTGAHAGDGQWSNEIYGGDLEGITQRIDYLKALGVNVIYLNPVFWSISNHRYDAVDYTKIDPILGDLGDFTELVEAAEANGMKIVLDGVFNHVSDDSVYFDRYYRFLDASYGLDTVGAYPYWAYVYDYMAENSVDQATAETAAKSYFTSTYGVTDFSYVEWFEVRNEFWTDGNGNPNTFDSMGDRAGKPVYAYEGWWGYDSMPVIKSTNGSEYQTGNWAQDIIYNENGDSVTQYWISQGNNGWRLDVANEVSDETWQRFRESVKALDSEAVIIGEIWDDATEYILGDMYDSVMNYVFRTNVTKFAMDEYDSVRATKEMEKLRERYPEEAFYAMMNLVGSHDTTRILSYLDGIADDRNNATMDTAFPTYAKTSDTAKARQYLVSLLQFTYAGAPTIYYGDEIGMVGADDPDDRRAMEWGRGQKELVEWYAKLAAIRASYPALRTGSVEPLDLKDPNLLAFLRADAETTITVIANNASEAKTVTLDGSYVDLLTGEAFDGIVPADNGVILVAAEDVVDVTVNHQALAPAYDQAFDVETPAPPTPDDSSDASQDSSDPSQDSSDPSEDSSQPSSDPSDPSQDSTEPSDPEQPSKPGWKDWFGWWFDHFHPQPEEPSQPETSEPSTETETPTEPSEPSPEPPVNPWKPIWDFIIGLIRPRP